MTIQPSRRTFIKIAAGTGVGLVIGLDLPVASAKAVEFVRSESLRAGRTRQHRHRTRQTSR